MQDVHWGRANKEIFFVWKLRKYNVTENAKIIGEFRDDGVQCQMSNTEEMNCRITRVKVGCHWNMGKYHCKIPCGTKYDQWIVLPKIPPWCEKNTKS